jgi:hypothetical protein
MAGVGEEAAAGGSCGVAAGEDGVGCVVCANPDNAKKRRITGNNAIESFLMRSIKQQLHIYGNNKTLNCHEHQDRRNFSAPVARNPLSL